MRFRRRRDARGACRRRTRGPRGPAFWRWEGDERRGDVPAAEPGTALRGRRLNAGHRRLEVAPCSPSPSARDRGLPTRSAGAADEDADDEAGFPELRGVKILREKPSREA